MTKLIDQVLDRLKELPVDEQEAHVVRWLHDLDEDPCPAWLKEELDRRIVAYEANPNDVYSWEQVKAEMLARTRK